MNYLSNNLEFKIKFAITEYFVKLIENGKITSQSLEEEEEEDDDDTSGFEPIYKLLHQVFNINSKFAKFSLSNKYIEKSDIIEIIQYCNEYNEQSYGRQLDWMIYNDFTYLVTLFGYYYGLDNRNYIIELINKLLSNYDNTVVLK